MSYHPRTSSYRCHRNQESYGDGRVNYSNPKLPFRQLHHHGHDDGTFPGSWRPLPVWEKKFCKEVGGMSWKRFVKTKKNLYKTDKVFEWNDSAGFMAFMEAKRRFWAKFHGFPCNKLSLSSADLYIDKNIDWNPKIDPQLFSEIKCISDDENEVEVIGNHQIEGFSIPLDQIIPTGWDVDVCDYGPRLPKVIGY